MRHVLFAAAALAIGGFAASTVASAQTFQGSPSRIGNLCKVATDLNGDMDSYGYYEPCGKQARAQAPAREAAPAAVQAKGFQGGAPARIGSMCKVATDANGDMDNYGYYVPCGLQARAQAPARETAPAAVQAKGFQGGAPARIGNMCKVATDANGDMDNYGYYVPCTR